MTNKLKQRKYFLVEIAENLEMLEYIMNKALPQYVSYRSFMIIWLIKEIKKDKGEMIERQTRNRENIVVTNVGSAFVTRIIQELQH